MNQQNNVINKNYQLGKEYFRKGKVREAYRLLNEVLKMIKACDVEIPVEIEQDCKYLTTLIARKKELIPDFVGFDMESIKLAPDREMSDERPLDVGISCAALSYGDEIKVWQGHPKLTKKECQEIVSELRLINHLNSKSKIVTWNGCGFDYRVLAEESGLHKECVDLTLQNIDLMFIIFAYKGWFVSLDSSLKSMGLEGKLKKVELSDGTVLTKMTGKMAPSLWEQGEYEAVIAYLKEDADQTMKLAYLSNTHKHIKWASKNQKQHILETPLLTVRECLKLPLPDTAWMKTVQRSRRDVLSWITKST
jgi:hypothetical protein